MELDTNDLKVMGAVKKGITTFGGIKNGVNFYYKLCKEYVRLNQSKINDFHSLSFNI